MPCRHFREITPDNWLDCVRLKVDEDQEPYVASNSFSLAEAAYRKTMVPLAVYDGDTMVGFVMYDIVKEKGWIHRLMVGAAFQRKGYGRWALKSLIALLKARPDCREIVLDFVEGNAVAEKLYETAGFCRTGETLNGGRDVLTRLNWAR